MPDKLNPCAPRMRLGGLGRTREDSGGIGQSVPRSMTPCTHLLRCPDPAVQRPAAMIIAILTRMSASSSGFSARRLARRVRSLKSGTRARVEDVATGAPPAAHAHTPARCFEGERRKPLCPSAVLSTESYASVYHPRAPVCRRSYRNQIWCMRNMVGDVDIMHYSWTYFEAGGTEHCR